jgi:hypothetical protein
MVSSNVWEPVYGHALHKDELCCKVPMLVCRVLVVRMLAVCREQGSAHCACKLSLTCQD